MNRAEVQGAYNRTMRQIKQESSDAFERFRHVRSEACREANQRIKELKQQITRLECEILDAQERRAKIIEDARMEYLLQMSEVATLLTFNIKRLCFTHFLTYSCGSLSPS